MRSCCSCRHVGRRKLVELGEICVCWSADYLEYSVVSVGPYPMCISENVIETIVSSELTAEPRPLNVECGRKEGVAYTKINTYV